MRWARRGFWVGVLVLVLAVLHYNLPQTDIVHIVGTETRRVDFGSNSFFWSAPEGGAAAASPTRDVFFIQTVRPNGKPMVYRNENTGWGWPPYFTFDSDNVQAVAASLVSTAEAPKWVAITHYGWRVEYFRIFPNALGLRPVAGPEVRIIPWSAIAILAGLLVAVGLIWRLLVRLRERWVDPLLDRLGLGVDRLTVQAAQRQERARRRWSWLGRWFGGRGRE